MLSYATSAITRPGDRQNTFLNGKTQFINSLGAGNLAYFQKKRNVLLRIKPKPILMAKFQKEPCV